MSERTRRWVGTAVKSYPKRPSLAQLEREAARLAKENQQRLRREFKRRDKARRRG